MVSSLIRSSFFALTASALCLILPHLPHQFHSFRVKSKKLSSESKNWKASTDTSFATMTGQFFVIKLICPRRLLKIWPGWVSWAVSFYYHYYYSVAHNRHPSFLRPPTIQCTTSISTESNQACHTSHQRYTRSRSKWRSQDLAYQDRKEGDHCVAWKGFHCGCVAGVEAQIWWWMN